MGCSIRPGTRDDIDILVELIQTAFRDVAERFGLTPQNSPTHPSNCRAEWLLREFNRGVPIMFLKMRAGPPDASRWNESMTRSVIWSVWPFCPICADRDSAALWSGMLHKPASAMPFVCKSGSSPNTRNCMTGMKSWDLKTWSKRHSPSLFSGLLLWLTIS